MTTRRKKLHDVLQQAVDSGKTVYDLLLDIEEFTNSGRSGIETFLDQQLDSQSSSKADALSAAQHIEAALSLLKYK